MTLNEAAKTREARLEEELKKAKAEQQAATEARDAGVKRQQQERKSLEDDYDMERKGLREEIKVLEDERSEILAGRAPWQPWLCLGFSIECSGPVTRGALNGLNEPGGPAKTCCGAQEGVGQAAWQEFLHVFTTA